MNNFTFPKASTFRGSVYRNIATCFPSQDIYDDIVDKKFTEAAFELEHNATAVLKSNNPKNRVLDYGNVDILYPLKPPWHRGRFGDGHSYGVLYTSLEEKTSILETIFHLKKTIERSFLATTEDTIKLDRRMFKVDIDSRNISDLRGLENKFPGLVHPEDYSCCQKVGEQARSNAIGALLTPSARTQGSCMPIFQSSCVQSDHTINYVTFIFKRNGKHSVFRSQEILFDEI